MYRKIVMMAVVVIMFAAVVPNLNAQTVLLGPEGFEGSFPPSGWTRIDSPVPWQWVRWLRLNWGSLYRIGTYSAGLNYAGNMGPYGVVNDWLITPTIDLTGYSSGTVLFGYNCAFNVSGSSYYRQRLHYYVKITTDGGSSWDPPIVDMHGDPEFTSGQHYIHDAPNPFVFDISDYLGENIRIAFHIHWDPPSGSGWYWLYRPITVDSVWVTHEAGGAFDLEMAQIVRPNTKEEPDVPFTPACKVKNKHSETVEALVRCRIREVAGEIVYEDALNSFPFEPGYNDVTAFKDFTPEGGKSYNALFVVEHPDDINPDNNDKDKNFYAELGIDVTPFEIVSPAADTQINAFAPSARYAENKGRPTDADLIYTVEDFGFHAIIETDTVAHSFAGNDTFTATFGNITLEDGMTYIITFWAESEGENISNPPMPKFFTYTGIAETPVPERTSLEVVGHMVNFNLSKASHVSIRVYDVAGKLVATLVEDSRDAGYYNVHWNTAGVASGVYFVKMLTPEFSASGKMVVLY